MKRILIALVLVGIFVVAYGWFSRADKPAVSLPAPAVVADPQMAEREALFGVEALAKYIQWRESGLGLRVIKEGTPPKPGIGTEVRITYVGKLKDGSVFDRSDTPTKFLIGATIPGLSVGLQMLGTGGKAVIFIPPSLGYGGHRVFGIPPDSGLIFEVEVSAVNP